MRRSAAHGEASAAEGNAEWLTTMSKRWKLNAESYGAECRLKGLAKGTPERLRIEELDRLLMEHRAKAPR